MDTIYNNTGFRNYVCMEITSPSLILRPSEESI